MALPRYRRKELVVDGGHLVSLIMIHGEALLFDVNDLLDFASVPLQFKCSLNLTLRSRLDTRNARVGWVVVTRDVIDGPTLVLQGSLVLWVYNLGVQCWLARASYGRYAPCRSIQVVRRELLVG